MEYIILSHINTLTHSLIPPFSFFSYLCILLSLANGRENKDTQRVGYTYRRGG